jgi:general secretion pathway protein H
VESRISPHLPTKHVTERGVTLVEIMVVLVLIALIASATAFGTGSVGSSRLRGAAATVVAYSRVAITRTNATGRPVRMVFDLDKGRIWLEESSTSKALRSDPKVLSTPDEMSEDYQGPDADRARAAKAEGEASAELFIEGRGRQVSDFEPLKGLEIAGERVGESRELGTSIEYHQVQIEHEEEPRTEGRTYLYFWPGGETEWASIQLRRSGDKSNGLTVLVSPLSGRARIERGYVSLPGRNRDGEISELEGDQ